MSLLFASVVGPSIDLAKEQIHKASELKADGVELRLDCFESVEPAEIRKLMLGSTLKFLFTLRKKSQGGFFSGSEEERMQFIEKLMALRPHFFDVESDMPALFLQNLAKNFPQTKLLCSHHDFVETPADLNALLERMAFKGAYAYKIAAMAQNTLDALRMLLFLKESTSHGKKVVGICMGECGQATRILGRIFGSFITFAALDESQQSAPGQLTLETLCDTYHYHLLSSQTKVYGLIGHPVKQSISHYTHNQLMRHLHWDAVYIKMLVAPEQLKDFFWLAKQIHIRGLSVTIPLKEQLFSILDKTDSLAKDIGAVNTVDFGESALVGYNTDGIGALDALEEKGKVAKRKVVVIGAGGSAKAIAYVAKQRGAELYIFNRHPERAKELASQLHCFGGGLDDLKELAKSGYDIIINTTPDTMPIAPDDLVSGCIAMDINFSKDSLFLQKALEKKCQIVFGYQMFVNQAVMQFSIWSKKAINTHDVKEFLQKTSEEFLASTQKTL